MNVHLSFSPDAPPAPKPEPIRTLTVPQEGRYMLLVDDWDTEQWDRMPRSKQKNYKKDPPWNALPATIPTTKTFWTLNEEWQWFHFDLMRRATFGTMTYAELLSAYQSTTRDAGGWRDRHTWNNVKDPAKVYTDYVLGLNIPPEHTEGDAEQQDLLSSGNIVKVLGTAANGKYIIETLDILRPPPSVDKVWGKWWLVGFLTLSAYDWDRDVRARIKWPFFNGYGCPHMTIGKDGVNYMERAWCRPIENGATYNLYTN